ncbi:MAG: hypothetical protein ABEN55_09300 [Bradymonadaceae bacterium]
MQALMKQAWTMKNLSEETKQQIQQNNVDASPSNENEKRKMNAWYTKGHQDGHSKGQDQGFKRGLGWGVGGTGAALGTAYLGKKLYDRYSESSPSSRPQQGAPQQQVRR